MQISIPGLSLPEDNPRTLSFATTTASERVQMSLQFRSAHNILRANHFREHTPDMEINSNFGGGGTPRPAARFVYIATLHRRKNDFWGPFADKTACNLSSFFIV